MNNDLLLEWMSERESGSWQQLREAHTWLSASNDDGGWRPTPGFTARMLATLGHVEINWEAGRWAAAPPVLTILPSAGAHALLTGGRTRTLRDQLTESVDDPCLYLIEHAQRLAPTALLIACEDETHIERLAERLGVRYEFSVSDRLSTMLPSLDSYLTLTSSTPVARGYGVEELDLDQLRWRAVDDDTTPGLYRYDLYGRPAFRLIVSADEIYAVDLALGVWAALSRWGENRLRYLEDSVNGTMIVPIQAPLPALQSRVAALCSGLEPGKYDDTLRYRNVPRPIAARIAQSLDQTLVEPGLPSGAV